MTRVLRLLLFVLSFNAALGTTVIPTDSVEVVPGNAARHDVSFSYGQMNGYVTVIMPYTKGDQSFDSAHLQCTNSSHRFYVPIEGLHPTAAEGEKDVIVISFEMDGELARECILKIFFAKGSTKGTEYLFSLKNFVPAHESANKKTGAGEIPAVPRRSPFSSFRPFHG